MSDGTLYDVIIQYCYTDGEKKAFNYVLLVNKKLTAESDRVDDIYNLMDKLERNKSGLTYGHGSRYKYFGD